MKRIKISFINLVKKNIARSKLYEGEGDTFCFEIFETKAVHEKVDMLPNGVLAN